MEQHPQLGQENALGVNFAPHQNQYLMPLTLVYMLTLAETYPKFKHAHFLNVDKIKCVKLTSGIEAKRLVS
jgi:hypothetical protein